MKRNKKTTKQRFKKLSSPKIVILVTVTLIGVASLLLVKASTNTVAIEAEASASSNLVVSDISASGGKAVLFETPSIPIAGVRPTRENTGPRYAMTDITPAQFISSRVCNRQRITGNVDFNGSNKGQSYKMTDCEVSGRLYVYTDGGNQLTPLNSMVSLDLDHVDVMGGLYSSNGFKMTADYSYFTQSQISLVDSQPSNMSIIAPFPLAITNSMFYAKQAIYNPDPAKNPHTEALHALNRGEGYKFTNVAFVQQGPLNNTATATINFHGKDSVFDNCWFLWQDGVASYYVAYIDGPNNIVKNSWFDSGAGYIYPSSLVMATYLNNRNVNTGELINLP